MNIIEIPSERLEEVWHLVEPIISLPIQRAHGEVTLETTKNRILQGISRLFVVIEKNKIIACATFEIYIFDSGKRVMFMPMMGATGNGMMEGWGKEMHDLGIKMTKENDCSELRAVCSRPGWLKVLTEQGWKTAHTIMRLEV